MSIKTTLKKISASLCLLLLLITVVGAETSIDRFERVAGRIVEAINAGDYEGFQRDFSKIMLEAFPLEKSRPFFERLLFDYGRIVKLGPPRLIPPVQAIFPAHFERGILDIKLVLDGQDKIAGLWFLPHTPDIPVPEEHETRLSLPFEGSWLVFWGGDTSELNQHHDTPNQRFAFDFLIVDESGKSYRGDRRKNEDYFAFGRRIVAPADGVVTEVIRGVRDNVPGSMNPYSGLGNAVMIEHREHEVSVLAHLKQGSIKVKAGDRVKRGQLLGLCGNSGNSSEPHLHYHLQNTPVIQDGTGIKCYFEGVILTRDKRDEKKKKNSLVKGDIVRPE